MCCDDDDDDDAVDNKSSSPQAEHGLSRTFTPVSKHLSTVLRDFTNCVCFMGVQRLVTAWDSAVQYVRNRRHQSVPLCFLLWIWSVIRLQDDPCVCVCSCQLMVNMKHTWGIWSMMSQEEELCFSGEDGRFFFGVLGAKWWQMCVLYRSVCECVCECVFVVRARMIDNKLLTKTWNVSVLCTNRVHNKGQA